jgi:cellulose synthase/poly-beta-1,6-N-acetylglucosamine synthase-like glycosyltransferase
MSISVIIPTLNEAARLPETLRSVRAEKPSEIVVVDGGRSNATCELAREVGSARSLLAYELPDGRRKLIDGHGFPQPALAGHAGLLGPAPRDPPRANPCTRKALVPSSTR